VPGTDHGETPDMHVDWRADGKAVVVAPEAGDDPDDLEDEVHDAVHAGVEVGAKPTVRVVVLDLSGVRDAPRWLKAAGPAIPDVILRVALGAPGFKVARMLGIPAFCEWYATVDEALTGG
jgi:hypothetical protein